MKSKLKLKNLKGLATVSEKAEINIEANKLKDSYSFDDGDKNIPEKVP
jgi:hypothetical protein